MRTAGEFKIRAPRSIVWQLLVQPESATEYSPELTGVIFEGGPAAVGARQYTLLVGARTVTCNEFISVCEPFREYTSVSRVGMYEITANYRLEVVEGSSDYRVAETEHTRLTSNVEMKLASPLLWLLMPFTLFAPVLFSRFVVPGRIQESVERLGLVAEGKAKQARILSVSAPG